MDNAFDYRSTFVRLRFSENLLFNPKKEELYECTGHLEEQKATKNAYELNWFFSKEV